MEDRSKIVKTLKEEILHNEFLYSEIVKRHVEEFNIDLINDIKYIKNSFLEKNGYDDYFEHVFAVLFSQALDYYRMFKNGIAIKPSLLLEGIIKDVPNFFKFDNPHWKNILEQALSYSYKYNLNIFDVIYPVCMESVLAYLPEKIKHPIFYRFETSKNNNFNMFSKNDKIYIKNKNFLNNNDGYIPIEKEDSNFFKFQFLIRDIINGKHISSSDLEFVINEKKNYSDININKNSFAKYAFGIYCWDLEKEYGNYNKAFFLYKRYQEKSNQCSNMPCFVEESKNGSEFKYIIRNSKKDNICENTNTCQKFIREARRLASLSIRDRKLYDSKTKGDAVKPNLGLLSLRYPCDFFSPPREKK